MEMGNKRFKIQALEAQSNKANKKKNKKGKTPKATFVSVGLGCSWSFPGRIDWAGLKFGWSRWNRSFGPELDVNLTQFGFSPPSTAWHKHWHNHLRIGSWL
jgi:hypothetical protein